MVWMLLLNQSLGEVGARELKTVAASQFLQIDSFPRGKLRRITTCDLWSRKGIWISCWRSQLRNDQIPPLQTTFGLFVKFQQPSVRCASSKSVVPTISYPSKHLYKHFVKIWRKIQQADHVGPMKVEIHRSTVSADGFHTKSIIEQQSYDCYKLSHVYRQTKW